ncbi:hypothetical protein HXS80_15890 [Streptomyces sp. CB04723]|uniref:hypothetical protein n=1 Tax=Streptomyces TaxID=1883 RepID=UPI0015C47B3B|nr:hypothetical protein [Streptomyces sp. CB04723]QLG33010.1 hypothetical protein HXS80_15890 [Streptomyces sp. CB04723]
MTDLAGAAEIVGGAILFLLLVYRQVRTGARDAWREVAESQTALAESQTARAQALDAQVQTLIAEVRSLRLENEALRIEVASLRRENSELREHIDNLIGGPRGDSE